MIVVAQLEMLSELEGKQRVSFRVFACGKEKAAIHLLHGLLANACCLQAREKE